MNEPKRIWAVVPVKSFARAKARLAPLLDGDQRQELARAMLEDVLAALRQVDELSGILLVSGDASARDIAAAHGVKSVDDPVEEGPNAAIRLALPILRAAQADAMVVIPCDIPAIEAADLWRILRILRDASVVLVRAVRDGGTNLLGCSPIDALEPCFGAKSFVRHVQAAQSAGLELHICAARSLMYDIDQPEDVLQFRARRTTKTGVYLSGFLSVAAQ
jgi:2-phospho-L-lactate guanylyltransferase